MSSLHWQSVADRVRERLEPMGTVSQAASRDLHRYYDAIDAQNLSHIPPGLLAALLEVDPPDWTAEQRVVWPVEAITRIVRHNLHIVHGVDVDHARLVLLDLTTLELLALIDWKRRMENVADALNQLKR